AVRAKTGAGKVEGRLGGAEQLIELTTDDGEVRITLPEAFACDIDATTDDGRVIVECDLDDGHDSTEGSVTATRNGGGTPVRLHAGVGDITISVD
ncbi:DUF4097 family beta strand repeat protein, partial [Candidatus Poribacteria bacterium]|nr:DUF4097 family beta strand repeat protein [Candidatus Poribacteria bacterium]